MSDSQLAREMATLRLEVAALGGIVHDLFAKVAGLEKLVPTLTKVVDPPVALSEEERELQSWIASLPCFACKSTEADTIRHLRNGNQIVLTMRTPGGNIRGCCRITQVLKRSDCRGEREQAGCRPDAALKGSA
jgi:hypothetical protein